MAFAVVIGAGVVGGFQAEPGYTRAFLLGAAGALVTLVTARFMPRRASPA
jgi:hypothetical protein